MGYETRIHVVAPYQFKTDPPGGELLAVVNLCKCGYSGPLAKLIAKHNAQAKEAGKPSFGLYAVPPDRQHEAVEFLREIVDNNEVMKLLQDEGHKEENIKSLSDDIEDGYLTKDRYGDNLGVIDIDDFIAALQEELKIEKYRRYEWALALLTSIKETYPGELKIITYGY